MTLALLGGGGKQLLNLRGVCPYYLIATAQLFLSLEEEEAGGAIDRKSLSLLDKVFLQELKK